MNSPIDDLLALPPFGVAAEAKAAAFSAAVGQAMTHHNEHCPMFHAWCEKQGFTPEKPIENPADLPFLPVGIFKRLSLCSVPQEQVVRVVTSSATSSQVPSRIVLDQITRNRQMRALSSIMTGILGGRRRPFVILDAPPAPSTQGGQELSARAAGMRGYLMAATMKHYALDSAAGAPVLNVDRLLHTVEQLKNAGGPFGFLGYTYMLYQSVVRPLHERGVCLQLPENVFVLHFGGWKKLQDQAVDRATLNGHTAEVFGIPTQNIRDIYGFTEQLGVIYPDRGDGVREVPTYAEVIVRDPHTLQPVADGETGLLEFICPLPHGYPGVAILVDDIGRIVSRHMGPDGTTRRGFEVIGRAKRAEPRGCGDTLPSKIYAVAVNETSDTGNNKSI